MIMVPSASRDQWTLEFASEDATLDFAREVSRWLRANDLVTLSGDLGSGKTTFARAMLRALTGEPGLEVPSPTFTLMQVYPTPTFPVVHADLFRIKSPDEMAELGWDEASDGALVLVEWADRAGDQLPDDRLDIAFYPDFARGDAFRLVVVRGHGGFVARVARAQALNQVLQESDFADAQRHFMQGDASTRAYERLVKPNGATAVLMFMPARAHGPVVRFGKSYGEIAKLAQDIRAFAAMDTGLRGLGLSTPVIYSLDIPAGIAVLEDLGSAAFVDAAEPIIERYSEALSVLARLHAVQLPEQLPLPDGALYTIPSYDFEAQLIELELLLDWFAPHIAKVVLPASARSTFTNLWRKALNELNLWPTTWTLRDFHSPNLIWLADREGLARVGLVDFQDCVIGHPAYDVAALLQDARVTISDAVELRLLSHYARLRQGAGGDFSMAAFTRAYALLGAQRNTKILGIFARLDKRDHKPQYLEHLPRITRYLAKNLAHPALGEVRGWYETHLPQALASAP